MVIPIGSIINAACVMAGGAFGMLLGNRLTEQMRLMVFQGLGLCILAIGAGMSLKTTNPLYMVGSILVGSIIGEAVNVEGGFTRVGEALKRSLRSKNARFTEGFVTVALIVTVGAMGIVGSIEEGLGMGRTVLLTKGMLDFFICMAFGAVLGSGVLFAFIPMLIYQALITLFASSVEPYVNDLMRAEISATGGIMVMAIGVNMLEIKKIRISNMLPSLLIAVIICLVVSSFF